MNIKKKYDIRPLVTLLSVAFLLQALPPLPAEAAVKEDDFYFEVTGSLLPENENPSHKESTADKNAPDKDSEENTSEENTSEEPSLEEEAEEVPLAAVRPSPAKVLWENASDEIPSGGGVKRRLQTIPSI